jgi:transposase
MQARHAISDTDWARIEPLLPKHGPGGTKRRFVDAILFVGKTGIPWRDLPERFGDWNAAWKRFDRWSRKGVWQKLFGALQDPDLEWLILDSTVIRAHPCAAGAPKKPTARADKTNRRSDGAGAGSGPRFTCG